MHRQCIYLQQCLYCLYCQCVKLGSLPVCLSTTRLIASVFICKKAFTSSVFLYSNSCTANVFTRLTASAFIYKQGLYCQCVNSAHCQCIYLLQGPVCLSTTRLIANVFICKKASTSSVFFYNNLLQGLLPMCGICKKAFTYQWCVYLQQ